MMSASNMVEGLVELGELKLGRKLGRFGRTSRLLRGGCLGVAVFERTELALGRLLAGLVARPLDLSLLFLRQR